MEIPWPTSTILFADLRCDRCCEEVLYVSVSFFRLRLKLELQSIISFSKIGKTNSPGFRVHLKINPFSISFRFSYQLKYPLLGMRGKLYQDVFLSGG